MWRQKREQGDVIVVRFAMTSCWDSRPSRTGFERSCPSDFGSSPRTASRATRLLEFGPCVAENRRRHGFGKPEPFNFLGFTHICPKKRSDGRFTVLRLRSQTVAREAAGRESRTAAAHASAHPRASRVAAAAPPADIRYYGVPMNTPALRTSATPGRAPLASHASAARPATSPDVGADAAAYHVGGCRLRVSVIPILSADSTLSPEVGAGFGKPARPVLWRGAK